MLRRSISPATFQRSSGLSSTVQSSVSVPVKGLAETGARKKVSLKPPVNNKKKGDADSQDRSGGGKLRSKVHLHLCFAPPIDTVTVEELNQLGITQQTRPDELSL